MNNKMIRASMSVLVLSLSACVEQSSDDALTEEDESALSGGPWTWVNSATGRCLDSNGAGNVYALDCNGGDYQKWTNTPRPYGDQIQDLATGRCLDSDYNGNVYTLPCHGGTWQQWIVSWVSPGLYTIRNVQTGRCLDSNFGSVYTNPCNNLAFQRWY
jgi:Ricin-type beta-trefoil lectin domain